jgi:hypothetical protein
MARDDENEEKTNAFVDFLLEEDEELELVPKGEHDESAMDSAEESAEKISIELDTSFDLGDVASDESPLISEDIASINTEITAKTNVEDLEEDFDQDSSHDLETVLVSEPSEDSEPDNVHHADFAQASNDYPTVVTEAQPEENAAEAEIAEVSLQDDTISEEPAEDSMLLKQQKIDEENANLARFYQSVEKAQPENQLVVSQNLKKAQDKIIELEELIEKLRLDNQELGAAGEVLKRKVEELSSELDRTSLSRRDIERRLKEEVQHSQMRLQGKQQENQDLKVKVESLELRLKRDLQMVRVRERELENRLEIVKLENSALLRSKDEHILELKRSIDQSKMESEQLKEKLKKLSEESDGRQDKIRRTVRTLRLALNLLDEDDVKQIEQDLKKSG